MSERFKLILKLMLPFLLVVSITMSGAWLKSGGIASSGGRPALDSEPPGVWLKFSNCSGSADFLEGRTVWLYGAGASLYETSIFLEGYSQEKPVEIVLERLEGWTFTPPAPCFSDPGTNPYLTEVSSFPLNLRGTITVRRGDPETGELGTFDIEVIEYVPPQLLN